MSRENVEVARRWTEAYNRRDIAALVQDITPDFEMRSIFAAIDSGGVFRAPDGFPFRYYEALNEAYEYFRLIPHEFIDAGAAVLMVADTDWRGRGSGAEGQTPIWVVFWLRAGKIFREETFSERAQAFAAAGLAE